MRARNGMQGSGKCAGVSVEVAGAVVLGSELVAAQQHEAPGGFEFICLEGPCRFLGHLSNKTGEVSGDDSTHARTQSAEILPGQCCCQIVALPGRDESCTCPQTDVSIDQVHGSPLNHSEPTVHYVAAHRLKQLAEMLVIGAVHAPGQNSATSQWVVLLPQPSVTVASFFLGWSCHSHFPIDCDGSNSGKTW